MLNQQNVVDAREALNPKFMPKPMSAGEKNAEKNVLENLADESGLAVIVMDENSSEISASNNNSMCRALYYSADFAPQCAKYCGRAFQKAMEAGEAVGYECHAGLECTAVPVKTGKKTLVAIVGRAFLKAENYRQATDRAISGDWRQFPPSEFFENVLLSGSAQKLTKTAQRLTDLNADEQGEVFKFETGNLPEVEESKTENQVKGRTETRSASLTEDVYQKKTSSGKVGTERTKTETNLEAEQIAAWRSFFGSLLNLDYGRACDDVLRFIAKRYELSALAWLENRDSRLETVTAYGELRKQQFQINLPANDERLLEAFQEETALELLEKQEGNGSERQTIRLFPISIGGEIRSALVVSDKIKSESKIRHLARFCQSIASELEILRLREELSRSSRLEKAVRKFNESLKNVDAEDFWTNLLQLCAELMQAERGSLLVFDEKADKLIVKTAIGRRADVIKNEKNAIGRRVSRKVLHSGTPLIVSNIETIGLASAPSEWQYKTKSFISYPIIMGGRKIGVLNIADKVDGSSYNKFDLRLLQEIMPQIAVAIDRTTLKHKAGEYEQLSVTDGMTGLLNRRYLEERLAEETKRSNRYGYPMSFMMIDVDNFKSYNDTFGHPEGDKTLKIVAHTLRETLRSADVAARYGGEEFSILLPQTTSEEAFTIGERIREKVEKTKFPHRKVTISIGVASCTHIVCEPDEVIAAADKALYKAKRKGRNNVQTYEELEDSDNDK